MSAVWVVTTHHGWGEGSAVFGAFDSFEAAAAALIECWPRMQVYRARGGLFAQWEERGRSVYAEGARYQIRGLAKETA